MKFSVEVKRGTTWHKICSFEQQDHAFWFAENVDPKGTFRVVENWPRRKILEEYRAVESPK